VLIYKTRDYDMYFVPMLIKIFFFTLYSTTTNSYGYTKSSKKQHHLITKVKPTKNQ